MGRTTFYRALAVLLAVAPVPSRSWAAEPPVKVGSIQARLFYDNKGTFSEDVLSNSNIALWNVVIGEGSTAPSQSTLVLVELIGSPGPYQPNRRVQFTARYKKSRVSSKGALSAENVVVSQKAPIGGFGSDGRTYVGFWLYDTGCVPVQLTAGVDGEPEKSRKKATIPFKCGE